MTTKTNLAIAERRIEQGEAWMQRAEQAEAQVAEQGEARRSSAHPTS